MGGNAVAIAAAASAIRSWSSRQRSSRAPRTTSSSRTAGCWSLGRREPAQIGTIATLANPFGYPGPWGHDDDPATLERLAPARAITARRRRASRHGDTPTNRR